MPAFKSIFRLAKSYSIISSDTAMIAANLENKINIHITNIIRRRMNRDYAILLPDIWDVINLEAKTNHAISSSTIKCLLDKIDYNEILT